MRNEKRVQPVSGEQINRFADRANEQSTTDPAFTSMKKVVALKYDPETQKAPQVLAKGRGYIAEKILESAKEHGIPVQEDKSLVEVLSKLDIEQEIPAELYTLVAEVLSFVYRTDRKAGGRE